MLPFPHYNLSSYITYKGPLFMMFAYFDVYSILLQYSL